MLDFAKTFDEILLYLIYMCEISKYDTLQGCNIFKILSIWFAIISV